jgi:sporulation protein YlmC with PRC-barrel domain
VRSLRVGEEVLGRDGRRLGEVERLVVDEHAHRITHLVVGDRLIGARRVRDVDGSRLAVELDHEELARQPEARHELVGEPGGHWHAPGGYSLADFLRIASALVGQGPYVPPVHLDLDLSAVHEIGPGSPVFAGSRNVGEVVRVLTDDAGAVTDLVVRRPGVIGHRVRLPAARVTEVIGTAVHVDLSEAGVEALSGYEEPGG